MNIKPVVAALLVGSCVLVGAAAFEHGARRLVPPGHHCHGEALMLALSGERWERCW
jgi:hypothetical protein